MKKKRLPVDVWDVWSCGDNEKKKGGDLVLCRKLSSGWTHCDQGQWMVQTLFITSWDKIIIILRYNTDILNSDESFTVWRRSFFLSESEIFIHVVNFFLSILLRINTHKKKRKKKTEYDKISLTIAIR